MLFACSHAARFARCPGVSIQRPLRLLQQTERFTQHSPRVLQRKMCTKPTVTEQAQSVWMFASDNAVAITAFGGLLGTVAYSAFKAGSWKESLRRDIYELEVKEGLERKLLEEKLRAETANRILDAAFHSDYAEYREALKNHLTEKYTSKPLVQRSQPD